MTSLGIVEVFLTECWEEEDDRANVERVWEELFLCYLRARSRGNNEIMKKNS